MTESLLAMGLVALAPGLFLRRPVLSAMVEIDPFPLPEEFRPASLVTSHPAQLTLQQASAILGKHLAPDR